MKQMRKIVYYNKLHSHNNQLESLTDESFKKLSFEMNYFKSWIIENLINFEYNKLVSKLNKFR